MPSLLLVAPWGRGHTGRMSRILLFEPDHSGHRLHYVRLIAEAAVEAGHEVTLATTRAARSTPPYLEFIGSLEESIDVDAWIEGEAGLGLRNAIGRVAWLRESVRRSSPDHVLIPFADGLAQPLGVVRRSGIARLPDVPMRGLLFRCGAAYPGATWRQRASARAATLYPWDRLFHLDEVAVNWYQQRGQRLEVMPDPIDAPDCTDRVLARNRLGVPPEGVVIGTAGVLDGRKGIDLLIRAFVDADVLDSRLLLVGKVHRELTPLLDSARIRELRDQTRIVVLDQWVEHPFLLDAISAMDVVCTPYPRHMGSASILLRAAAAGRPVLGSDFGWIGHMLRSHAVGETVAVGDPDAFRDAVRTALNGGIAASAAAMARLAAAHSPSAFTGLWLNGI